MANRKKKNVSRPPDQGERNRILTQLGTSMLVEAAAGTGKTTSMVDRMVALLSTGECADIRTLSAVTFTRKATAELRSRFQLQLERAVGPSKGKERERLTRALAKVEQCFIGTIHSFCGRLLRERPVEAGVDLSFREIEQEDDESLRRQAWSDFVASLHLGDPDGVLKELEYYGLKPVKLEDSFVTYANYPDVDEWPSPEVEKAAISLDTGRKKVKSYLAHIRKLAPRLPDTWGTDTYIPAFRNLLRMDYHSDLEKPADLMDLIELFTIQGKLTQKEWKKTGNFTADECKAERDRWLAFREEVALPLTQQWMEQRYEPLMRVMARAREIYDRLRRQNGQLNFQDLLLGAAGLLRQGPHVREYFARRFTHLLVDEFHDTDPIQAEVMLLLTATDPTENDWRKCRPRPGSLFVVGDPKQSIYRFRRADIVTYNAVKKIIQANGTLAQLSANFRSSEPIIGWVNQVFEPGKKEDDKAVHMLRFAATDTEHSPAYVPLQVGKLGKPRGALAGLYRLDIPYAVKQKEAILYEADLIARTIRKTLDSDKKAEPGDFMIVTYNTRYLSKYGQALQEYGIPHQVTGGSSLNEVAELKLLHTCLKAVVHPDDPTLLVATLRSELFGVSDAALHAFKQAGGRFSYFSEVPKDLPKKHAGAIGIALGRLRTHAEWMGTLPWIAACEKILGDLGLLLTASTRLGGNVEAGSLAKALELLRAADRDAWNPAEMVDYLGEIVEMTQTHDGIPARPQESSLVRVMNLHKVKGLEAKVVFLACPKGENLHSATMHIDRSGDEIHGYMVFSIPKNKFQSQILAQPPGWAELEQKEAAFARAEKLRLRYVAATRAGRAMIVSQCGGKNKHNPWQFFNGFIPEKRDLVDPGEQKAPPRENMSIKKKEVQKSSKSRAKRLEECAEATYDLQAAKKYALDGRQKKKRPASARTEETPPIAEGAHGLEWGSAIHSLLEVATKNPNAELRPLAETLLAEYEIEPSNAESAVATVRSVMKSDIWKRAMKSKQRFSEIPFHVRLEKKKNKPPTVVRGSIDLIFKETEGWVLVDYKTDSLAGRTARAVAEKYAPQVKLYAEAWEKCCGEKVVELGCFVMGSGDFVAVKK